MQSSSIDATLSFFNLNKHPEDKKQFIIQQLRQTGIVLRAILLDEAEQTIHELLENGLTVPHESVDSVLSILKHQLGFPLSVLNCFTNLLQFISPNPYKLLFPYL